ncbi:endopeptidase La [Geoalkalibacter halelectricus]|uniref:endopeptidase La n=1 Tax=Geoalkalibacter halelectricus TaxID=2847045 RepID=UPI003D1CBEC8
MQHSDEIPRIIPIFPLRDQVVFPYMVFPLFVGIEAMPVVEEAMSGSQVVGLFFCARAGETCRFENFAPVGTACRITQVFRLPEGGAKVMVEGLKRVRLGRAVQRVPFVIAQVEPLEEPVERSLVAEALVQSVNAMLKLALAHGRPLPGDVMQMVDRIEDPGRLADLVTVYLSVPPAVQQRILEIMQPLERLKDVYLLLSSEVQKQQVRGEIQTEVSKRIGKTQKEFLLREQMKQIQEELGDEDPRQSELNDFRRRIDRAGMPEHVRKIADKELQRLERINSASPEYTVSRTYLEYLCTVPWSRGTENQLDINRAEQILDEDHFDLKDVKDRILEYLAVRSLRKQGKGPILCFVGPPGVGKTSLGRSIARALGRKFIRIALGGMKDEAEIRGHRRTYIGALPGRIIQEICRAESNNPVFMLDEVDKIGQDFRGDPASALLEVLDPEQNNSFHDHYLDVAFDLSHVMFITTANVLDPIPGALRDRMEMIRLPGYSDEEKEQIAFRYLIPKQIEENGLGEQPITFESAAVRRIVNEYTREAGVRNLERQIAAVCRKLAREITQGRKRRERVTADLVAELLGPRKFFSEVAGEQDRVGVATGLAWTETGGDILFVEASQVPGKKELTLTGSLGGVMQESARTALSFVRAHARDFDIDPALFENTDLHIHVPAGSIPKDGPSAGVTIALAVISLLTGRPARRQVAMTGELTLTGRILPIGGVKEKVLAAHRAGVRTVLLPERNRAHVEDLSAQVRKDMELRFVATMDEVAAAALLPVAGRFRRPGEMGDPYTPAAGPHA